MKLLDTNVVLYARGRAHPNRQPCIEVLEDAVRRPGAYGVDVELLQEVLEVYVRRGESVRAIEAVRDVLTIFPEPFPISRLEIEGALDIVGRYRGLSPRDALHAAVVIDYGLEGIVSADTGFDLVSGVARFDPRDLAAG